MGVPSSHRIWDYGLATSIGLGRRSNQDAWLAAVELGVFAVADGVGGGRDGDIASREVIAAVAAEGARREAETLDMRRRRIQDRLKRAHDRLKGGGGPAAGPEKVCASTLAALVLEKTEGVALSQGDSRVFRLRDGRLCRLTRDDARYVWRGTCGWLRPRSVLSHAIGAGVWREPRAQSFDVREKDVFLLCTDGLWRVLGRRGLQRTLESRLGEPMQFVADHLVAEALAAGGKDNITCCVVRIAPEAKLDEEDDVRERQTESDAEETGAFDPAEAETCTREHGAANGKSGSMLVEFVIVLGGIVLPIFALLLAEVNGRGFGLMWALRSFCGRIQMVIGSPLL